MRRIISPLVLLSLFALAFGFATAGPTTKKVRKGRTTSKACTLPEPTAKQCLQSKYLTGKCLQKWSKVCKPHVQAELAKRYKASKIAETKMLRPNQTEMPKHLRMGKKHDYTGPRSGKQIGSYAKLGKVPGAKKVGTQGMKKVGLTPAAKPGNTRQKHNLGKSLQRGAMKYVTSDNIFSRTGLTRPPNSGARYFLPKDAHRNPAWDKNGQKIETCEEYAYEQLYDWTRFTDATAACAGNHVCELDIAFLKTTPGIADRTLRRKDGKPLKTQFKVKSRGRYPKNEFFAGGAKFAYAAGPDGLKKSPEIDQLAAALKAGEEYYRLGCTGSKKAKQSKARRKKYSLPICGGNTFKNEWGWHGAMHERNRTVSMAEYQEYLRRKHRWRELVAQWIVKVEQEKEKALGPGRRGMMHKYVNPLDEVTQDPFERMRIMTNAIRDAGRNANKLLNKMPAADRNLLKGMGAGKINKAVGTGQQYQGALNLDDLLADPLAPSSGPAVSAHGVLAVPKGKSKPSKSKSGPRPSNKATKPMCSGFGSKVAETAGIGPISCQIGVFLRQEWKRKLDGQYSCLDLDSDDCDWDPMLFNERFVQGVPYIADQQAYEVQCIDYTNDSFKPFPNLTAAESFIKAMKAQIEKALKALAPHQLPDGAHGKRFGKAWTDSDQFGDKDWFAAGYNYDMGWDIETLKTQKKGNTKSVCELGGGARGQFGAKAWIINKKLEVVDGKISGDVNRNKNHQAKVHAHLRLFGADLFKEINQGVALNKQKTWPAYHGKIPIPLGWRPSFTFMAGPIPVTGAAWGEFMYGADIGLKPILKSNCDMEKMKFGMQGTFEPIVALNGKAQVGIGISGLVSAGIRGMINLLRVGLPITTALYTVVRNIEGQRVPMLGVDLDIKLSLATLSGYLAVYLEFLLYEEEWVLFRWNGLGPETISLLGKPLETELPLFNMVK